MSYSRAQNLAVAILNDSITTLPKAWQTAHLWLGKDSLINAVYHLQHQMSEHYGNRGKLDVDVLDALRPEIENRLDLN